MIGTQKDALMIFLLLHLICSQKWVKLRDKSGKSIYIDNSEKIIEEE